MPHKPHYAQSYDKFLFRHGLSENRIANGGFSLNVLKPAILRSSTARLLSITKYGDVRAEDRGELLSGCPNLPVSKAYSTRLGGQ